MMDVTAPGLAFYADRIKAGKPFAFVRYGNGEWDCILGLYHTMRSGSQRFTPDLRDALMDSLQAPRAGDYFTAMQSTNFLKRVRILPWAERWLMVNAPRLVWHDGEVFARASRHGQLNPLVKAMRARHTIIVGPPWLKKLSLADELIPVRSHNCWQDVDKIYRKLARKADSVISFSAGPAAKVLIWRLWPEIGKSCWLVDLGSVWDPYCGVQSRHYHKHVNKAMIKRNMA